MVRLDLANDDAESLEDAMELPTPPLRSIASPFSGSSDEDDDDAPAVLSTLVTRQTELSRERDRREEELKAARQRKDARRARDARLKAAKPTTVARQPSSDSDDGDAAPVASTLKIARLPSSVFAEAAASIEAARSEAERAEKLKRNEESRMEHRRRAKRRRLDEAPQEGSSRDLGSVTVQHLVDPSTARNDPSETVPSSKKISFLKTRLLKRTRLLPRGPRPAAGDGMKKVKKTSVLDGPSLLFPDAPSRKPKRNAAVEKERRPAHLVASGAQVRGRRPALAFAASQRT